MLLGAFSLVWLHHLEHAEWRLKLYLISDFAHRPAAMFSHVDDTEARLMKTWHAEGLGIKKIGARLNRSPNTVSSHVFRRNTGCAKKKVGAPRKITPARLESVLATHAKLLAAVKGKKEVTINMVKRRARLKCSDRTVSRAFAAHGIRFRPLYEKPGLTEADRRERLEFAKDR